MIFSFQSKHFHFNDYDHFQHLQDYCGLCNIDRFERNMMLLLGILAICAVALLGSPWLRYYQYPTTGLVVTALVAIPSVLFGLFMLIAILPGSKWN
jgi:hypothetical protein